MQTYRWLELIWLVPLLPLAGAATMFFFGRRMPKKAVNAVCVGAVVLAFLLSTLAVWQLPAYSAANEGKPFEKPMYTWLGTDTGETVYQTHSGAPAQFRAEVGFLLDPLSAVWLLFVTGVGMLIHVYSTGYMAHEGGYYRFFGYLNLFMFSMLVLILGNNYAMMFVGWEGVGLCSFLLIGFYFKRHSASTAANKAFIVNRIGDAGFLLGLFTIAFVFGSVKYTDVTTQALTRTFSAEEIGLITAATLLLFVGAAGKSAQIPLYVWLPDAMEGPTPVSALIHAATMVTAGVYMVARSNALYVLAPDAMMVVAVIGALTAIVAASIGLVQNDIKRVLAYSTVSQLGYMFLALGVGAWAAGVFHVFTHAFFKALLFLGAGSVIHAMSGEQDMRHMGDLRKRIPVTFWTMAIATLAITGIFPFAGFFSKDEILWQVWLWPNKAGTLIWAMAFVTAMMTAFYMARLMFLTFFGQPRMSHEVEHHIHESPRSMTVPLIVLAFFSLFAGFLGFPRSLAELVGIHSNTNRFEHFLSPVFSPAARQMKAQGEAAMLEAGKEEAAHHDPVEYLLMVLAVGAAVGAGLLARRVYGKAGKDYREPIAERAPPVYNALYNKYYVDEAYDVAFTGRKPVGGVRLGAMGLGEAAWKFDANVVDGLVNGAGWGTRAWSSISMWWDKWIIDGLLVNGIAILTRTLSYPARLVQWGLVQWYALVMALGLVTLLAYYLTPSWVRPMVTEWLLWSLRNWYWILLGLVAAIVLMLVAVRFWPRPSETRAT